MEEIIFCNKEDLTPIANHIRAVEGITEGIAFNTVEPRLEAIQNEINLQSELLEQIDMIVSKGESTEKEYCNVKICLDDTFIGNTSELGGIFSEEDYAIYFDYFQDQKKKQEYIPNDLGWDLHYKYSEYILTVDKNSNITIRNDGYHFIDSFKGDKIDHLEINEFRDYDEDRWFRPSGCSFILQNEHLSIIPVFSDLEIHFKRGEVPTV